MTPPVVTTIEAVRATLDTHRAAGRSVGFVPTMGSLHAGHRSLIEASVAANDVTIAMTEALRYSPYSRYCRIPFTAQAMFESKRMTPIRGRRTASTTPTTAWCGLFRSSNSQAIKASGVASARRSVNVPRILSGPDD